MGRGSGKGMFCKVTAGQSAVVLFVLRWKQMLKPCQVVALLCRLLGDGIKLLLLCVSRVVRVILDC